MPRAGTGHAPRQDLAALLHEWLKHLYLLVVDKIHPIDAEAANLLLAEVLPLAFAWAARRRLAALALARRPGLMLPRFFWHSSPFARSGLARGGDLLASARWLSRAPRHLSLTPPDELLLALQFLVQTHGLILEHRIGYLQAPLELLDHFALSAAQQQIDVDTDRKSTRLNSSHLVISYAVF